jgi:hypothetical protein
LETALLLRSVVFAAIFLALNFCCMNTAFLAEHPLVAELRERRTALVERLGEIVREVHHVKETVLPPLFAEYDKHFRALEIELQQATLTASELVRREELFRLKLERGEVLSAKMIEVVNTIVDREFARVRKRFREAFEQTGEEREKEATTRNTAQNMAESETELVKLYRAIVKKLHPDANTPLTNADVSPEKRVNTPLQATVSPVDQFWHSAQEAYKRKNLRDLQAVYDLVCLKEERENFTSGASAEEHLRLEISRLEGRLRVEERKLRDLTTSEPYTLREFLKSPTWRESECKKLSVQITEKQRESERSRVFLASIHAEAGFEWHDHAKTASEQEAETFKNDFMENTYFNFR